MNLSQFFATGFDPSQALVPTYDPALVLAAYAISALAGYAFLRLTTPIAELGEPVIRLKWMAAGGLTMGLGVWAMHFVAMLAYQLPIPVGYDPLITALSAVPAIVGAAVALYLVARPTVTLARLLLAGTFMGAGIGTMHYTGMAAMHLDALVRYDPALFLTSIFVAVALAVMALLVTTRAVRRTGSRGTFVRNIVGALIMGLAVSGMHYTAMSSTMCFAAPGLYGNVFALDPQVFAAITTSVVASVLIMAIVSVIFDRRLSAVIEKRSVAAARVRNAEQHLAVIMDNIADAVVSTGTDGKILSFSRSAERIFGYTAAEAIGQDLTMLMAESMREPHTVGFRRYLATGEARVLGKGPVEVMGRNKNGTPIAIELVVSKAREGDKTVFIGAMRDITERKITQAQLQQAQKMEAVGQLTGGIAHDFNNLLGIIIGNLDLLKEGLDIQSSNQGLVNAALDSALRGAELNRRLLAFARRQSLQPEVVDVNRLLTSMTGLLDRATGERIVLRLAPGQGVWPIKVDHTQLEASLINLAVNARDAMTEGGTLIIETTNMALDNEYAARHPGMKAGDHVCLVVSDTGTGMTPEVQARAFEPFFTTKGIGKGSGLGLSMVFGFIKQSGGHVSIYSEPGHGTVVRLYFPRVSEVERKGPVERHEMEADFEVYPTGSETVMVVEDNEAMGNVVTKQLEDLGYRVIEAGSAADALQRIEDGVDIDLLFTDVVMPGAMDGIALTLRARALRPDLKVLLTSGFTQRAKEAAADTPTLPARLLAKPYRKLHLAKSIRQALDE